MLKRDARIKLYIYALKSGENSIDERLVALVTLMAWSTSGPGLTRLFHYLLFISLPFLERSLSTSIERGGGRMVWGTGGAR